MRVSSLFLPLGLRNAQLVILSRRFGEAVGTSQASEGSPGDWLAAPVAADFTSAISSLIVADMKSAATSDSAGLPLVLCKREDAQAVSLCYNLLTVAFGCHPEGRCPGETGTAPRDLHFRSTESKCGFLSACVPLRGRIPRFGMTHVPLAPST